MAFQLSEKTPCGTGTCATIHSECNPLDNAVSIIKTTLAEINATGAKEKTLTDGISSIEGKFDNIKVDLTPVAKEETLQTESQSIKDKIDSIEFPTTDLSSVAKEATLTQGISEIKSAVTNIDLSEVAKEATLIAKVAELKEALNSIDFTAIEQAIQNVEDVTAREATLIQGVGDIIQAVENIDFTDLENSIAEVKNAVVNIDFSALAKENTLTQVASKVEEESQAIQGKIDNIKLPEVDTTELASKDLERFFGIKPIEGYEFMTEQEVYDELEVIMTTMDGDLTAEMAASITEETISLVGT